MAYATDSRSLAELFSDLTREIASLVRSELALARVELGGNLSRASRHAGTLAVGAVVAVGGFFTLTASVVLMLIRAGLAPWLAALVVGFVLAAAGVALATRSLDALRRQDLTPRETLRSLKESTEWTRQTM